MLHSIDFGIGSPKNAQNKEAACLLMQLLASQKTDKMIALAAGNPSRYSTHKDVEVSAKFPHMATFGERLKDTDPDWRPIIPIWGKINADLGTSWSKFLTEGADIQTSLYGVATRAKDTMANRMLLAIPPIIFTFVASKQIVTGMTAGAVTG